MGFKFVIEQCAKGIVRGLGMLGVLRGKDLFVEYIEYRHCLKKRCRGGGRGVSVRGIKGHSSAQRLPETPSCVYI